MALVETKKKQFLAPLPRKFDKVCEEAGSEDNVWVWFNIVYNRPTYYHPSTKLWEGKVFSCVCLSFCSQVKEGWYVTITHDALGFTISRPLPSPASAQPHPLDIALYCTGNPNPSHSHQTWDLTVQGPKPNLRDWPQSLASEIWWSKLETCSNLFTW